jgi:hypothetical protein
MSEPRRTAVPVTTGSGGDACCTYSGFTAPAPPVRDAFGCNWIDPVIGLALAAVAVNEGREAWRREDCC